MSAIRSFFQSIRQNKLKIFSFVVLLFVFFIAFFPYSDLRDLVSAKVSEATQKQVYLDFEDMGFSLIPQPGLELQNVYAESIFFPAITAESVSAAPSIRGLLSFKPGVTINAENLLKGDLQISTRGGEETKSGNLKQVIDLDLENISIGELMNLIASPVALKGNLEGEAQATVDPQFQEQPEGEVEINVKSLHLPPSVVQTAFGPLNVPELKVSQVSLKGRLKAGELFIDNLKVGNSKDEINGTVKGRMRLRFAKRGVQITPVFGRYEIDTNIKTLPQFEKKAGLFLSFIDSYKTPEIGGSRYALRLSGARFGPPPQIQRLQK